MGRVVRTIAWVVVFVQCSAAGAFAAVTLEPLCIRIYDITGTASHDRAKAMDGAGNILREASVSVDWRDCSSAFRMHPACGEAPAPGELVVRMVRSASTDTSAALGEAFIDRITGKGVLATLFVDRIEAFAAVAKVDLAGVVARVLAHEIGHLLLGSRVHTHAGLMRESFSPEDWKQNHREQWAFSRSEVDRIRRTLRAS